MGFLLEGFSLFTVFLLPLMLELLVLSELVLQVINLSHEVFLVVSMSKIVRFDLLGSVNDMILQLGPLVLRVIDSVRCILHIFNVIIDYRALGVQRNHGSLESLDLNLLLRDHHLHLVLLVEQHLLVVVRSGGCCWSLLGALGWA